MSETVLVGEHTGAELREGRLTSSDLARLERLRGKGLLNLTPLPSGYRLSVRNAVGVLSLDRVRLVLEPKLPVSGRGLIDWLCYASGAGMVPETATRRWQTDRSGFADLVIHALLEECRGLAAQGLRRDYVERSSVESALRGRLDFVAQATRRFGMVDRLHVHAHERSADIWENQVCATALSAAVRLAGDPTLARSSTDCARSFPRPLHLAEVLHHLRRGRYTRLNDRYRSAHVWAGLLLGGGGVQDLLAAGEHSAGSLVLSMPALWEAVVRRLCLEAMGRPSHPGTPMPGPKVSGDSAPHRPFRPDVLVTEGGTTVAVDAKYKDYAGTNVSSADVHQLLTYGVWYTPQNPRAVIVYPSERGTGSRTLRVGGPARTLGTIDVVGVDTGAHPETALPHLRSVLAALETAPNR